MAGSVTKEGFSVVAEKTKMGAQVVYDKLDETGITDTAKVAGGYVADSAKATGNYVYEKGSVGISMLNSKIDEHETLAQAKRAAAEKASQASAYVSSFFGWGKSAAQTQDEPQAAAPEEAKGEAEEIKEDEQPQFAAAGSEQPAT